MSAGGGPGIRAEAEIGPELGPGAGPGAGSRSESVPGSRPGSGLGLELGSVAAPGSEAGFGSVPASESGFGSGSLYWIESEPASVFGPRDGSVPLFESDPRPDSVLGSGSETSLAGSGSRSGSATESGPVSEPESGMEPAQGLRADVMGTPMEQEEDMVTDAVVFCAPCKPPPAHNSEHQRQSEWENLTGYLQKYTNLVTGWQFRYFVLVGAEGRLEYHVHEHSAQGGQKPRGTIALAGAVTSPSEEEPYAFTIITLTGEQYRLRAKDARERQHWVSRLQGCVQHHTDCIGMMNPVLGHELYLSGVKRSALSPGALLRRPYGTREDAIEDKRHSYPGSKTLLHGNNWLSDAQWMLVRAYEEQRALALTMEALPRSHARITPLDPDLLLLKASAVSALGCLHACLHLLQMQRSAARTHRGRARVGGGGRGSDGGGSSPGQQHSVAMADPAGRVHSLQPVVVAPVPPCDSVNPGNMCSHAPDGTSDTFHRESEPAPPPSSVSISAQQRLSTGARRRGRLTGRCAVRLCTEPAPESTSCRPTAVRNNGVGWNGPHWGGEQENCDEDELTDEGELDELDLPPPQGEEHCSIILHMLSQLKLGMDLTKVVLPTFILECRSLLEMFSDFMAHTDAFLAVAWGQTAEERMYLLLQYYLSSFREGRKGAVAKKPYNPIIGEVFRCSWLVPRTLVMEKSCKEVSPGSMKNSPGCGTESDFSSGEKPEPRSSVAYRRRRAGGEDAGEDGCYRVWFVAEQVSHHPPVSAFYVECAELGMCLNVHLWTKSKFLGMSVGVSMVGEGRLWLQEHGEEYVFTLPSGYARSILTVPWVELGGKVSITCARTCLAASVTFHTKPFYGGKLHRVTGEVRHVEKGAVLARAQGEWNGLLEFTATSGETVIMDTTTMLIIPKHVQPIERQELMHSRRLWQQVTSALRAGDIASATEHKHKLEEWQRAEERARVQAGTEHVPKYFLREGEGWVYRHPLWRNS
ncbi:oxysterol-binding protein-related protein 11-like isoform X2 [Lethenteron reissneri]|uniref:oxysterol-binding protein-related protein 11-like isoform X2 n=1 Tax=Lethenteron reissneri TaxID=7753 RepID=UPI002AB681CF|nr:oxysterol-binding protein-related protein 11-like isoform X2 [Lethenteron reissneri]